MPAFCYADLHCHPNLKTFGHSFDRRKNGKSDIWHTVPSSFYARKVLQFTGITKFSQTDLATMSKAKAKIAFVSLYPFEKGFFTHKNIWPALAAFLADWGIEIGYERVRHIQQHTNYFTDLLREYEFLLDCERQRQVDGQVYRWALTSNWSEVEALVAKENTMAVILTIEGAHVFNTGLGAYGVPPIEAEVLANIETVKKWDYVPLFIGLAHNFNNDLCGHARSLQRLGKLVNQSYNLDTGISPLGYSVIQALLNETNGARIYVDIKHMSIAARLQYYHLLQTEYASKDIPIIMSHGAVTGCTLSGAKRHSAYLDLFNTNDINVFDEEIVAIARSGGLLAIQMDRTINADVQKVKAHFKSNRLQSTIQQSAAIIWNQLQHVAQVCDNEGLFAWGSTAIGSDFDGSISPFPGITTATGLEALANELIPFAHQFLASNTLSLPQNKNIAPEEIADRFLYTNIVHFLQKFYIRQPLKQYQHSLL